VDLSADAEGFFHSIFSENREQLLKQEIADLFFAAVVNRPTCAAASREAPQRRLHPSRGPAT
jgi:hypothetical protein